jgi:hypothetical protein
MNKVFRDNLEFLFDRFESQDLCAIVVSNSIFVFLILVIIESCLFTIFHQQKTDTIVWYLGIREAA